MLLLAINTPLKETSKQRFSLSWQFYGAKSRFSACLSLVHLLFHSFYQITHAGNEIMFAGFADP